MDVHGDAHEIGEILRAGTLLHPSAVILHRLWADFELRSDFLAGRSYDSQIHHLAPRSDNTSTRESRSCRPRQRQQRNGTSSKTVLTEDGEVEIAVPRDRAGSFEPQLIAKRKVAEQLRPKGQTRFDGFDDKILTLYARGMTVREIQATWPSFVRSRPW
jgi:hypothetical protein